MPKVSERQATLVQIEQTLELLILWNSFDSDAFENEIQELLELKAHILSFRYFKKSDFIPKSLEFRTMLLTLPHNDFRQALRMNKDTFNFILNKIENHFVFHNNSLHKQQPVWLQLLVALERFGFDGNASSIGKIARSMGISNGTVVLYSNRVIEALLSLRESFIKWPTPVERQQTSDYFEENHKLTGCVGVVDGTLVNLCQKPSIDPETYWTRKQKYSMNVQIFCNHKREIIYYQVGYPGSCHDSTCFKHTDICKQPEKYFSNGEYLIADCGYSLSPNLIVPYRNPQGDQLEFNRKFSSARIIVEHVMGLLKGRWSSLRGLRVLIQKEPDIEIILNNMVMKFKDNWEEEVIDECEDEIEDESEQVIMEQTGTELRERLKERLYE